MNNYFEQDWPVQCRKQITFAGVLLKYYDAIAKKYHWGIRTKDSYAKDYEKNILPRLKDRPLSEYTAEDYKQLIYDFSEETDGSISSAVQSSWVYFYKYLMFFIDPMI